MKKYKIESIIGNIRNVYLDLKSEVMFDITKRKDPVCVSLYGEELEITKAYWLFNTLMLIPYSSMYKKGIDVLNHNVIELILSTFTSNILEKHINKLKEYSESHDRKDIADIVKEDIIYILNEISSMSGEANIKIGPSISLNNIVEEYIKNPQFRELVDFPETIENKEMTISEAEEIFKKQVEQTEKVIRGASDDFCLKKFVESATGINIKQTTQVLSFVGTKPNIDGSIVPSPIKHNFLKGLKDEKEYYINAVGARKAQVVISKMVSPSGYFYRQLNLLAMDTKHNQHNIDCGSDAYVDYVISNQAKLNSINNRNYLSDSGEIKEINSSVDLFLLGKTIKLRSPMTCLSRLHGGVCLTCYGKKLGKLAGNKNTGILSVLILTGPITQKMLDAKHFSTTTSKKITWLPNFNEYFIFMDNVIKLKDEYYENSKLIINEATDVNVVEGVTTITFNKFDLMIDSHIEHFESNVNLSVSLFSMPELEEEVDNIKLELEAQDYYGEILYSYYNDELATSLLRILGFINSGKIVTDLSDNQIEVSELPESLQNIFKSGGELDLNLLGYQYNQLKLRVLLNKFLDSLIEYNLGNIRSVHIEMIMSNLLFNNNNKPFDFSNITESNIVIKNIKDAILAGPISKSLSFERVKKQLTDIDTFIKDESSDFDELFKF